MSLVVLNVSNKLFDIEDRPIPNCIGKVYVKAKKQRNCLQVTVKLFGDKGDKSVFYLENFRFDSKKNNLNSLYGAIRIAYEPLKGKALKLHSGNKSDLLL